MADQFCLRWNHFQTNIVSALDSLKRSEDLVDVTLTCEGRSIKAHKVILSACSPYFRNVFKENPCRHPVIILKDVSSDDIVSLLSYMYQGEVFIEESKLPSFLHTAALLQVKGLTGVTQQKENFTSANSSNKLYTQLTISPKSHLGLQKENKIPAPKKRRSSTSDKPNDVGLTDIKKRHLETNDIHKTTAHLSKLDNITHTDIEKRNEIINDTVLTVNGKTSSINQEYPHVNIKLERPDDASSPLSQGNGHSENDDSLPDYENSMLARSLLSGINPSKNDICANNVPAKKMLNSVEVHGPPIRAKDVNDSNFTSVTKSPHKASTNEMELSVKPERHSPKSDVDYEPEVLLSEQNDSNDTDQYSTEQSQALMMLAGMSTVPLGSGASTSQGVSHQSNHAAICGDCPHCGMKYSNQSALKYHVRLMHSDLTNRLCCYLCPRSFTMRETFKEHMWASHGQRN